MYNSLVDLVRVKMDADQFEWVDLAGDKCKKWDLCYEFTIRMMKRRWCHVALSAEECVGHLVAWKLLLSDRLRSSAGI